MAYKYTYRASSLDTRAAQRTFGIKARPIVTIQTKRAAQAVKSILKLFEFTKRGFAEAIRASVPLVGGALAYATTKACPSKRMADGIVTAAAEPTEEFLYWAARQVEAISPDEEKVLVYLVKTSLKDADWLKDVSDCEDQELMLFRSWLEATKTTDKTSDFKEIPALKNEIREAYKTYEGMLSAGIQDSTPVSPTAWDLFKKGLIENPAGVKAFHESFTGQSMIGQYYGPEGNLTRAIIEDKFLELCSKSKYDITKDPAVNGALSHLTTKQDTKLWGQAALLKSVMFNSGYLSEADKMDIRNKAMSEQITIAMDRMPIVTPSVCGTSKIVLGEILKRTTTQKVTEFLWKLLAGREAEIPKAVWTGVTVIEKVPWGTLAKVGGSYLGTSLFGNFILEESIQQNNFALNKLSVYDVTGIRNVAAETDRIIDQRWKSWIPIYGPVWSFSKFFNTAKDLSQTYRDRADAAVARRKSKIKFTTDPAE